MCERQRRYRLQHRRPEHEGAHGSLARLAGIAVAKDGALLVSDDKNGVIYRIAHEK